MRVRKHYSTLADAERQAFVQALLALKDDGRYDQHVRIYQRATCWARRGPAFLPWNRHFLLRFEEDLRSVEPELTLPYWDFCRDRSVQSSLWSDDFMGGDGRPHDGMVIDGPFATEAGAWPLVDGGVLVRRLGRDPVASTLPTVDDLEHGLDDPRYDVAPWDPAAASGLRNRLEGWLRGPALHNRVHAWVGGVMARDDAPDDPLFWLVHAFVDRLWSDWQRRHPGAEYRPQGEGPPGHNLDDTLWPWNGGEAPEVVAPFGEAPTQVRPRDLLDHRALGYAYDTDPGGHGGMATTLAIGEEHPTFGFGEDVMAPEGGTMAAPAAEARDRVGSPRPRMTTRMVGEEDPGPTTLAVGEEGPGPTTRLRGEEGPTTWVRGEEGPRPTTRMRGEEDPTTLAVGEEGPRPTTRMRGEEDPRPTTLAVGEEDRVGAPSPRRMTTLAVGEESPGEPIGVPVMPEEGPPDDEVQPGDEADEVEAPSDLASTMAIGEEDAAPQPMPTTLAVGEEDPHLMTTMAIGEEEPAQPQPTTLAVGEEGPSPQPTTLAVGEEGPSPQPTTLVVGEEGPSPQPTTLAVGEEGPVMTTLAVGEEGPSPQPTTLAMGEEGPVMTTLAVGEEGPMLQPPPTTAAVGEEAPQMTTLAMGEEGPPMTTLAVGEEGPPMTTLAMGEEEPVMTTLAVGEEDSVTQTVGEDGGPAEGGGGPFGRY